MLVKGFSNQMLPFQSEYFTSHQSYIFILLVVVVVEVVVFVEDCLQVIAFVSES